MPSDTCSVPAEASIAAAATFVAAASTDWEDRQWFLHLSGHNNHIVRRKALRRTCVPVSKTKLKTANTTQLTAPFPKTQSGLEKSSLPSNPKPTRNHGVILVANLMPDQILSRVAFKQITYLSSLPLRGVCSCLYSAKQTPGASIPITQTLIPVCYVFCYTRNIPLLSVSI